LKYFLKSPNTRVLELKNKARALFRVLGTALDTFHRTASPRQSWYAAS